MCAVDEKCIAHPSLDFKPKSNVLAEYNIY